MPAFEHDVPAHLLRQAQPLAFWLKEPRGFPKRPRTSQRMTLSILRSRVMMGRLCHDVPLGQELSGWDPVAEDNVIWVFAVKVIPTIPRLRPIAVDRMGRLVRATEFASRVP